MSLKKESYRREREGGAGGGSGRGEQLFLLSAVHSQPLKKESYRREREGGAGGGYSCSYYMLFIVSL